MLCNPEFVSDSWAWGTTGCLGGCCGAEKTSLSSWWFPSQHTFSSSSSKLNGLKQPVNYVSSMLSSWIAFILPFTDQLHSISCHRHAPSSLFQLKHLHYHLVLVCQKSQVLMIWLSLELFLSGRKTLFGMSQNIVNCLLVSGSGGRLNKSIETLLFVWEEQAIMYILILFLSN